MKWGLLIVTSLSLASCAAYGPARGDEKIHRNVVYSKRSDGDLRLDLYVPQGKSPAPVIVWFHGGSWKYGDKGYSLLVRDLTKEGFAVASVQYRLIRRARWPAQIDDCAEAVRWLRENGARYGLDSRRIGLSGESAGGHLAALLGVRESRARIKAVLAAYPPTDLLALGQRYAHFGKMSILSQMFGGPIEEKKQTALAASPIHYVSRSSPPFLFFHGDKDWLVPINQSESLSDALKAKGVESELVVVAGKGHAFAFDDSHMAKAAEFFRRHLN